MLLFDFTFLWMQEYAFLLFPLFCSIFVNYRLFSKKEYDKLFFFSFLEIVSGLSLFFLKETFLFEIFLSFVFFLLFFSFLFYFFDLLRLFFEFNVWFEFYFNLFLFLILLVLSLISHLSSFNLSSSILGLFIFALLRIFYIYWKAILDEKFSRYSISSFLIQWTYFWGCSITNLIFIVFVLFFWDFDYLFLLKSLQFLDFHSIFSVFLGLFGFPYFIYFCDYVVDSIFSRMFSVASGYSSRARTFKSSLKWIVRIFFGLSYFSFMYVNFSTVSWNLSVLFGVGTLGFKGVIDDFINGICVLIEDSVNIGEFIQVGDVSGTVEDVSLRVIKLRNFDGSLYVIPFRRVEIIKNRSKDFVYIVFDLIVDLQSNSSTIIKWLTDAFLMFKSSEESVPFLPLILEDIEIIGITSITAVGVGYRSRLKILPSNPRFIKAIYLKFLKDLAEQRSINFGFEHAVISEPKK